MTRLERVFVWLGGAAFAGSLVLCAYAFMFRWSRTGSRARVLADRARRRGALHRVRRSPQYLCPRFHQDVDGQNGPRSADPIGLRLDGQRAPGLSWLLAWRPIGGDLYHAAGWTRYAHAGVQLAGVWLIARSVGSIDALELAGIRSSGGPASLQIAGPYRFVRHPLYLGWMLIVFGAAHMTGDRIAFAAITTTYLMIAMPWEERSLERTFGTGYTRYKQQVPWRVIPFVY